MVTDQMLEFTMTQVAADKDPWTQATAFQQDGQARNVSSLDLQPRPWKKVNCGYDDKPDYGCTDENRDLMAAYAHALP